MPNPSYYYQIDTTRPQPVMAAPMGDRNKDAELSSYLNVLYAQRWFVALIVFVVLLAGISYTFLASPVYEANVLIHVEEESPKESRNLLAESGSMFNMKTTASAEIELFQSRLVISNAVEKLNLDINGKPEYLPVIGKWLARYNRGINAPAWLATRGYAWGGERIEIGTFSIPEALLNREFELKLEDKERFRIIEPLSGYAADGFIGKPSVFDLPSGRLELLIKQINARPGTRFKLVHSSRQLLIDEILMRMQVAEQGKQSGIIRATLRGDDADSVNNLLSEIAKAYMSQNAARKTQEADGALAFLEKQLPETKQQLDLSETRYAQFRNEHSMVDLGEEGKISLQQSAMLKTRKIELDQKRSDLLTRFTAEHPFVKGLDAQLADVNAEIRKMAKYIKGLPLLEQELVRLSRDVKVNAELHTALLNTARQLRLTRVAKTSNVRLVDMPLKPEEPVSPRRGRIIGASLLAGLMLGVFSAFVRKSVQTAVEDPSEIEQMLGMPMYAAIPYSKAQNDMPAQGKPDLPRRPLLACTASADAAIESLRNFRTVLQYNLSSQKGKVVLITGALPGCGKSFVAANLAVLLGSGGKRVLLIDGDLRNGKLQTYFGISRRFGLSEILAGEGQADDAIHKKVAPNLDFLSTGELSENSSELLLRPSLAALLKMMEDRYDVILIDSAPVLLVSDSIILGMHSTAIYLLTRTGITASSDMFESVKRLNQAGLTPNGFLFNGVSLRRPYGYGYGPQRWRANYSSSGM